MNENKLPRHVLIRRKPGESNWVVEMVTTDPNVMKSLIGDCVTLRLVGEYIYSTPDRHTDFAVA